MEKDEIVSVAKKNLVEGERWHKKVNVREIVFGFNDGSISTLALRARALRRHCPRYKSCPGWDSEINAVFRVLPARE